MVVVLNGQDLVLGQKSLNFALQFARANASFAPSPTVSGGIDG